MFKQYVKENLVSIIKRHLTANICFKIKKSKPKTFNRCPFTGKLMEPPKGLCETVRRMEF